MVETLENPGVDYIRFEPEYSTLCSVGKRPFWGKLIIEYRPVEKILEFESFEEWLMRFALMEETIESLARKVFDELYGVLDNCPLRVTVTASTTVHSPVVVQIKKGKFDEKL